jgi:hypothetical protein
MNNTLTTTEAAKLAGVAHSTINAWKTNGHIDAQWQGEDLTICEKSLRRHMAKRSKGSITQAKRYRDAPEPEGLLTSKAVAKLAGVLLDTTRNRLLRLRTDGVLTAVKGEGVYSRTFYYEPETVALVRDYKPPGKVSHLVKTFGGQGALDKTVNRSLLNRDKLRKRDKLVIDAPAHRYRCDCGYSGSGLIGGHGRWRCWQCFTAPALATVQEAIKAGK